MAMLGDIKIMMLKGEKGDKGDGSYDDSEIRELIAQETADREEEIAEMERNFLNYLYPVGSIYMSVGTTSPAVLFGGTWEKIKDRFLLASGDTYSSGQTGGVASNPYTPVATIGGHTLTIDEIPNHTHKVGTYAFHSTTGSDSQLGVTNLMDYQENTSSVGGGGSHTHSFNPESKTFDNMPPYLTVNVWKRTA